jgi:hypothetical protein
MKNKLLFRFQGFIHTNGAANEAVWPLLPGICDSKFPGKSKAKVIAYIG